eukprot:4656869-Amphidinium_carterae.1
MLRLLVAHRRLVCCSHWICQRSARPQIHNWSSFKCVIDPSILKDGQSRRNGSNGQPNDSSRLPLSDSLPTSAAIL